MVRYLQVRVEMSLFNQLRREMDFGYYYYIKASCFKDFWGEFGQVTIHFYYRLPSFTAWAYKHTHGQIKDCIRHNVRAHLWDYYEDFIVHKAHSSVGRSVSKCQHQLQVVIFPVQRTLVGHAFIERSSNTLLIIACAERKCTAKALAVMTRPGLNKSQRKYTHR